MLRTNFLSRIKRVCNAAALVPRILRGNEQRITPVSCAAVKKSTKSAKTTDERSHEMIRKDNDDFQVMKKPSLDKNIEVINTSDINEPIGPLLNIKQDIKDTQYEKRQRIIEKTFGKEVNKPTEHYFSKGIDIEQTKQEIIKSEQLNLAETLLVDDRSQFTLFKTGPILKEVPEKLTAEKSVVKAEPKFLDTNLPENVTIEARTQFAELKTSPELEEEPEKLTAPQSMVKSEPKILDIDLSENVITDERITDERTQFALFITSPELKEKLTMPESVVKAEPKILDTDLLENMINEEGTQIVMFKTSQELEEVPEKLMMESLVKAEPKILDTDLSENVTDERITAERTQFAMFKPSPELEEVPENLTAKESVVNAEQKILETDPNKGFILMKPTMSILMSARAPDDLIKGTENNKELTNENLHLDETITTEELDKYVHSHENLEKTLYETHEESKQNAAHTIDIGETKKEQDEPSVINKCNSHIPSLKRKRKINTLLLKKTYLPNTADTDFFVNSDKKFNQIMDTYLHRPVRHNAVVNTTTAKEEKEQLTQKVEHIEETPLVEAQKPPVEGFNISPRVLGDLEQAYKWIKDKQVYLMGGKKSDSGELDEAAKRCLESPVGQIDEALLNELEKLGIPITTQNQPRSPAIDDNRVQMKVSRSYLYSNRDMYPERPMSLNNQEKILPDKDAEAEARSSSAAIKLAADEEEDAITIYPSHTHIDKNYDLRLDSTADLETEIQCVKQQDIHTHHTTQAAQVNPTNILMRESPKCAPFQDTKLYMNQTETNEPNEELKMQQYAKSASKETEEASTKSKPESPVTTSWNPFAKPGYKYVAQTDMTALYNKRLKKYYAKRMEKPLYYQLSTADSMWNSLPQQKPEVKYSHKSIPKPMEKAHAYLSMNLMSRVLPSRKRTPNAPLKTADEQMQKNEKAARQTDDKNLLPPLSMREEGPGSKAETNYMNPPPLQQHYIINSNVSDGIWDENVDALSSKQKMEVYPEELMKQQLDPHYVLTCNETCPITPKPTPESSRLMKSTEAIYETGAKQMDRTLCNLTKLPQSPQSPNAPKLPPLPSLPKLTEDVPLSELLKRVRKRSKIIECRDDMKALGLKVDPVQAQVGKCPRKAPQCPPTAPRSPPANPVPPPLFGLPTPPRRPPSCKPRKPRTRKCSSCDIMHLSSGLHLGPEINLPVAEVQAEMVCEMKDIRAEVGATRLKAELTLEVIEKLQTLGKLLGRLLRQGRAYMFDIASVGSKNHPVCKTMLARDYAPWAPIPSWPVPKPPGRRKPPCQAGCPSCPPPRGKMNPDPPCNLKPCEGFPKKSFSLVDCFAFSAGENKVYDIGQF